jgi:acetate CoA/acetoacetate CoA-transferase alpha subunit
MPRFNMQTLPLEQAVAMIADGASVLVGGFMAVGTPERVIDEIVRQNKRELTVIANDTAAPGKASASWSTQSCYARPSRAYRPQSRGRCLPGELEVELVPQGTLIERTRAGGCGLGGVLTQKGLGTAVELRGRF